MSSEPRFVYLHGFASGPGSKKAASFRAAFAARGWRLEVPDLNPPDFRELTVGGMLHVAEEAIARAVGPSRVPVGVIGSSLGGYLAAAIAGRRPDVQAAVLLAPAFDLHARWTSRLGAEALAAWRRMGAIAIQHYGLGKECLLDYRFYEESGGYPPYPDPGSTPVLVFHGRRDEVVPLETVELFARRHERARLRVLEDEHALVASVEAIVAEATEFFEKQLG